MDKKFQYTFVKPKTIFKDILKQVFRNQQLQNLHHSYPHPRKITLHQKNRHQTKNFPKKENLVIYSSSKSNKLKIRER